MKPFFFSSLLVTFFISVSAQAATFKIDVIKIKVDLPKGWQGAEDVLGTQLVFIGPKVDDAKIPVLQVQSLPEDPAAFDAKKLERERLVYKESRLQWIKSKNGKALEFFGAEKIADAKSEISSLGYRYVMDGVEFIERNYYARCKRGVYMLQSLQVANTSKQTDAALTRLLKSFDCE